MRKFTVTSAEIVWNAYLMPTLCTYVIICIHICINRCVCCVMRAVSSMRSFQEQSKREENHREQDEILYFWGEKRRKKKFPTMGETHMPLYTYIDILSVL